MNTLFQPNLLIKTAGIALLFISVTGCSVFDSYRAPPPQARSLPKIPEIQRQTVVKPRYVQPVKRAQKAPVARTKKPSTKIITPAEITAAKELLKKQAKENAIVDIDPYAAVPESNSQSDGANSDTKNAEVKPYAQSSPAVKSLIIGARADIALGKNSAAVSKLERGLRIESQNPNLWHLLSKANYSDGNYQQSINMAKKSIRYSNDDNLIAQNWALIKKAGEKSGNASAIREALDYIKLNP